MMCGANEDDWNGAAMKFTGNNDKLGEGKVRIAGDRVAKAAQEKTETFPLGVRGMVPLSTTKKGGGTLTVYVFKDAADLETLQGVIGQLDALMGQAEGLADCTFGQFEDVRVGVKSPGFKFCYVEYAPVDKRGFAMATPVRLRVEQDGPEGEPGDRSAAVEFDAQGAIVRAAVDTVREGGYRYRLTAMPGEAEGELVVHKIETLTRKGAAKLLYKQR